MSRIALVSESVQWICTHDGPITLDQLITSVEVDVARNCRTVEQAPGDDRRRMLGSTVVPVARTPLGEATQLEKGRARLWRRVVLLPSVSQLVNHDDVVDHEHLCAADGIESDAVVGAGVFAVALSDRPEVREVMRFMASPMFGAEGASVSPGYVPPNRHFELDSITSDVGQEIARIAYSALEQDRFRFDASDLMPAEIGTNVFWSAMIDLFSGEPGRAAGIATGIESAWAALEAGCSDSDATEYDIGLPDCDGE